MASLADQLLVYPCVQELSKDVKKPDGRGGGLMQPLSGYLAIETELWCVAGSKVLTGIAEVRLGVKRKQYDAALANGEWLPDRSR